MKISMIIVSAPRGDSILYSEGQELREPMLTHAPCLLLIDSSASMAGVKISAVEYAINGFFDEFKDTFEARYTDICIISFSDAPRIVQPFTCASRVDKIALEASGLMSLWEALAVSIDLLNNQRLRYNELAISYWRPRIILITGGTPTDSGDIVIPKLKSDVASRKYGLCVLGLPGYDEKLFSFLGVPYDLVQCDKVQDYLNKLMPGLV